MAEPIGYSRSHPRRRWHHRARHALAHSLRLRLITLFVLLAMAMAGTFLFGMQKALGVGWRDAARPLVADYVDRLVADIGSPPSIERAQALAQRLPITVQISGPRINWRSEPLGDGGRGPLSYQTDHWAGDASELRLLMRSTADGHRIEFGLSVASWRNHPRRVGWYTLAGLLVLTGLAYAYVRRLLRPLDRIREGAQRFGTGDFSQPIPVNRHHPRRELEQLAATINTMGQDIHQMLEAKRALLLAISHELRSPLTRARLNTELLPETEGVQPQRDALLRDLGEMRDLITDLLESERLGQGHGALQLEPTDLGALAREVVAGLPGAGQGGQAAQGQAPIALDIAADLPTLALDRTRMRLLLRNLLDNALRHGAGEANGEAGETGAREPPRLSLALTEPQKGAGQGIRITVRDHGPGVDEAVLPHLAEPFYRPDASRGRATGGVGLGLHLCKLVAQAHGGTFSVRNARPGLEVVVTVE